MRTTIEVREANTAEIPEIVDLCIEARQESAMGSKLTVSDTERLNRHLLTLMAMQEGKIVVAMNNVVVDQNFRSSTIGGFLLVREIHADAILPAPALYIEAIFVSGKLRRKGIGHALLNYAARIAQEHNIPDIYCLALPGSRGIQRFLARLGFAPAASHRVVTTAALLRTFEGGGKQNSRRGPRSLDELIARRRKVRQDAISGSLSLSEVNKALEKLENKTEE